MTVRIDFQGKIFFGVKVDGRIREQLLRASASARSFFEGPRAVLTLCSGGQDIYIGKVVEGGIGSDEVEDMVRHVVSVLDRIAPERSRRMVVHILPCTESGLPPPTLTPQDASTSEEE